jgi:hypothetical protein
MGWTSSAGRKCLRPPMHRAPPSGRSVQEQSTAALGSASRADQHRGSRRRRRRDLSHRCRRPKLHPWRPVAHRGHHRRRAGVSCLSAGGHSLLPDLLEVIRVLVAVFLLAFCRIDGSTSTSGYGCRWSSSHICLSKVWV